MDVPAYESVALGGAIYDRYAAMPLQDRIAHARTASGALPRPLSSPSTRYCVARPQRVGVLFRLYKRPPSCGIPTEERPGAASRAKARRILRPVQRQHLPIVGTHSPSPSTTWHDCRRCLSWRVDSRNQTQGELDPLIVSIFAVSDTNEGDEKNKNSDEDSNLNDAT